MERQHINSILLIATGDKHGDGYRSRGHGPDLAPEVRYGTFCGVTPTFLRDDRAHQRKETLEVFGDHQQRLSPFLRVDSAHSMMNHSIVNGPQ